MAAFRRRTHFAAPLIITVAAGCGNGSKTAEKPKRYPGRAWDVTMRPAHCSAMEADLGCPPDVRCNPPPPQAVMCPPGSSGKNVVRIAERSDKTCAVLPAGCFDETCLTTPTPCPLDYGKTIPMKLALWEIELRGGSCHVEEKVDCPPDVDCNPPAPRKVPCPPDITEDKDVTYAILADGTCASVPEGCTTEDCVGAKMDCP